MLKSLEITNFLGFSEKVAVKFAPITVLIGRNNSGKSSIIKFLLMLQQSLGINKSGFLVSRGEKTDLGSFHSLKNKLSNNKDLSFTLSLEDHFSPRDTLFLYLQHKKQPVRLQHSTLQAAATISYSKRIPFQGKRHSFSLKIENRKVIGRSDTIKQNSNFLDFANAQQAEQSGNMQDSETSLKIDAEKACIEIIANKILGIRHLGPDKKTLSRSFDTGEFPPDANVGQDGQFALHHLWNIHKDKDQKKIDFVNSCMNSILNIQNIRFTDSKDGDLSQCLAKNMDTGAEHNLAEFGHGLSQCFPIFVQGAIMPRYSTLICEQPEAHTYSGTQLELGQYFADLWKEKRVASIIETHSDSILLRLRRLISTGQLKSSDVNVAYFSVKHNGEVTVRNLSIENDGAMEEGLPMEFFHQNIWEVLEMGEGSEQHHEVRSNGDVVTSAQAQTRI